MSITVVPANDVTAQDDSFVTDKDRPVSGSVAANDSTTPGSTLTYALATGASHGTALFSANGTFTYTPNAYFHGPDSFTYTATDAFSGDSATATVSITVNGAGSITARGGDVAVSEDVELFVAFNDSTTSGGPLSYAVDTGPSHGAAVTFGANGRFFRYTPDHNFNGNDSFTYTVTDAATGESATAAVSIRIDPVNDVTAINDGFITAHDTPLSASVATNDVTTSGGTLSYALNSAAAHGTTVVNANGSFTTRRTPTSTARTASPTRRPTQRPARSTPPPSRSRSPRSTTPRPAPTRP